MDVNPLILITAGAAVVGAAAIVICRKPQPEDKPVAAAPKRKSTPAPVASAPAAVVEPTPAAAATEVPAVKKGKKKVRSSKKKKSAASASEPDDDSEEEPVKPAAKHEAKAPVAASASEPIDDDEDDNFAMYTNKSGPVGAVVKNSKKAKETPEQKAARKERQRQREAEKANTDLIVATNNNDNELSDLNNFNSPAVQYDGWNVVEVKKPKKKENEEPNSPDAISSAAAAAPAVVEKVVAAPEPAVPAAPVVETITTPVTVDSKKLGLLIGPKGVTKIGIQNLTGATIEMPKVEKDAVPAPVVINVIGPAASVAKAVHALNELILKGYCTLLAGDDFQEGYVAIHPRFLPDVIGKGGASIKALQQHTGVKITTPANTAKPDGTAASKVKIGLAGPREKVTEARNLIKEITKYYHTSVTHPGVVHIEMDIPANYYNYIIGSKGSEIKHIQNSFKVSVYIPNSDSANSNVLIVGEPGNVSTAEKHIQKLIEKVNAIAEQKAAAEAATLAFKAANAAARAATQSSASSSHPAAAPAATFVGAGGKPSTARVDKDDEPQEEWMKEFAPRSGGVDFSAILPSNAKLAAAAPPAAAATDAASSESS